MREIQKLFPILLALSLCGCAAQQAARHDNYCKSIGVGPGTAGYADCRLRMREMEVNTINSMARDSAIEASRPLPGADFKAPQIYHPF
jgi:hypothetical protein